MQICIVCSPSFLPFLQKKVIYIEIMEEISAKNVKKSIDKPFVLWYNLSTSAKEFFCCAHFLK